MTTRSTTPGACDQRLAAPSAAESIWSSVGGRPTFLSPPAPVARSENEFTNLIREPRAYIPGAAYRRDLSGRPESRSVIALLVR